MAPKHLSIGEVLVLLQEDFPDVTISKIRFLESQGLLDPDRTPSGYRKFYEADIAKLRWILRQQREHFLPLKVIKERLEESGGVVPDDGDAHDLDGASGDDDVEVDEVDDDDELDLTTYLQDDEGGTLFGAGTGVVGDADDEDDSDVGGDEAEEAAEEPTPEEEPVAKQSAPEPSGARGGRGRKRGRKHASDAPKAADASAAKPEPAAPVPRSAPVAAKKQRPVEPAPQQATSPLDSGPTDVTLTPEELAAAAGLSQRQLGELVAYNLLPAPGVAGLPCYDGDDLVVARVAAGFLAHGVEARHLKRWKAAAQAEAGIYEQVIMPALRSHDSSQRTHAREVLAELVELGDQLRGALLRETLRDHVS